MNIFSSHWLEGVVRDEIHGGDDMPVRRCVVIHFTSGASAKSSIIYMRKKGLSAHIVIDRDGSIFQCRSFRTTCAHAGVSRWRDPNTGRLHRNLNSCSIGIELANAGDDEKLAQQWTDLPLLKARHRNGGRLKSWEAFPQPQLAAAIAVTNAVVKRYNLDDITGHDCIAPERKEDPGPAFPMQKFREACGFTGLPIVYQP